MKNLEGVEKLDRVIHRSSDQSMTVGDVPASVDNRGYVDLPTWKREDICRRVILDAKAGRGMFSSPARRAAIATLQPDPVAIDPSERIPPPALTLGQACRALGAAMWATVTPTLEVIASALARILRRSP